MIGRPRIYKGKTKYGLVHTSNNISHDEKGHSVVIKTVKALRDKGYDVTVDFNVECCDGHRRIENEFSILTVERGRSGSLLSSLCALGKGVGIEADYASGNVRFHAALDSGLYRLLTEEIHVRERYYAVLYHLGAGQHRGIVHGGRRKSVLGGEDALIQPSVKRQFLAVPAEQRHRCMAVCIVKPREKKLSAAVYAFVKSSFRRRSRYRSDPFAGNGKA